MKTKLYEIKRKNDNTSLVNSVVTIDEKNLDAVKEQFEVTEIKNSPEKKETKKTKTF